PQVNIKNLIMASNTYSPPVLDSSLIPPLQPTDSNAAQPILTNGDKKMDQNENFIISSLAQKQNDSLQPETSEPVSSTIEHPLSISTSASHNSMSELNLNGTGGTQADLHTPLSLISIQLTSITLISL